jgi:hypothetical protein
MSKVSKHITKSTQIPKLFNCHKSMLIKRKNEKNNAEMKQMTFLNIKTFLEVRLPSWKSTTIDAHRGRGGGKGGGGVWNSTPPGKFLKMQ